MADVARDRSAWLLVRGRGERRLAPEVVAAELRAHSSSRRPSIQLGDRAVLYAAGWQVVFALADVVSEPENVPGRSRWAWRFAIRPTLALTDLREAPPVEAAGVFPRSLGRHSYIRLTDEQFELARAAIAGAARSSAEQARQSAGVRVDVKKLIEDGYDAMADRFAAWQRQIKGSTRIERVEELLDLLPANPAVLELGVGAGVRSTRLLAGRGSLTGVDLSAEQLRRASERIPEATFIHADFTELELQPSSFDAVVAAYVLNHVPPDELGPLALRVASWLRPGGYFLGTFSTSDNPGWTGEWLGVEMFFAGLPPGENRRLIEDAGLEIVGDEIEVSIEPDGEARFQWLLAHKRE